MGKPIKIHNHPRMEHKCGVGRDHVIIDAELFQELLWRFGRTLPELKKNPWIKEPVTAAHSAAKEG